MARKKVRKKTKKQKQTQKIPHHEIKGFFLLILSALIFVSLITFYQTDPSRSWLGFVGYASAYSLSFLFGLGAYFIPVYMTWVGWKLLTQDKIHHFSFRSFCFSALVVAICFLLTVIADSKRGDLSFIENRVYTETVIISSPYPHALIRYNLGGVPFYYFFRDLPYINLQQLLSNIGVALIFSFTGFVFFLLFSGIRTYHLKKTYLAFRKIFFILVKMTKAIFMAIGWIYLTIKKLIKIKRRKKTKDMKILSPITIPIPRKKKVNPPNKYEASIAKQPTTKELSQTALSLSQTKKRKSFYELPSSSILTNPPPIDMPMLKKELEKQAEILEATLKSFNIHASVGEINCRPTITSFEVHPQVGVKVQKIKALEKDIALNLQAKSIRIIAPIPGKAAVGVEVPSLYPQQVSLKEMLVHYQQTKKRFTIPLLLGKTVTGEYLMADLAKMPHLLIAGATGSGKSVCINTIVMSILMNSSPEEIRLLMIDPKKVELTQYSTLPHMIAPVITEAHGAYAALQWLVKEMQTRYEILKQLALRNITSFNNRKINKDIENSLDLEIPEKMPLLIAIVDEFADLMMVSSSDLETPIARIAQMARAVGIHLILATQRPSREVITGIIKANFPCRIAFKVSSRINSQIIIDENGADSLLGNGDLLFLPPGTSHMIRAQGAYISDEDINRTIKSICEKSDPSYLIPSFDAMKLHETASESSTGKDLLYEQAYDIILTTRTASTTFLQRKLKIGYARAASLMDELEENHVIGPSEGSRPRRVLLSSQDDIL